MGHVVDAMVGRSASPNEVIIREGEEADYLYVIEHGRFRVSKQQVRFTRCARAARRQQAAGATAAAVRCVACWQHKSGFFWCLLITLIDAAVMCVRRAWRAARHRS